MNRQIAAVMQTVKDNGLLRNAKLLYREEHLAIIAIANGYKIVVENVPETKKLMAYYAASTSPLKKLGIVERIQGSETHFLITLSGLGKRNVATSERACLLSLMTQVLAEEGIHMPTMLRNILTTKEVSTRDRSTTGFGSKDAHALHPQTTALLEKTAYGCTVKHNIGLITNPAFFHGERDGHVMLIGWPSNTTFTVPPYLDDFVRQAFVKLALDSVLEAAKFHVDGKRIYADLKSSSQGKDTSILGADEDCFFVHPKGSPSPNSRFSIDVIPVKRGGTRTMIEIVDGETGRDIGIYDFKDRDSVALGSDIIDDVMAHYETFGAEKIKDDMTNYADIADTVGRKDEDIDYGFDDQDEFLSSSDLDNLEYKP